VNKDTCNNVIIIEKSDDDDDTNIYRDDFVFWPEISNLKIDLNMPASAQVENKTKNDKVKVFLKSVIFPINTLNRQSELFIGFVLCFS